MGPSNQCMKQTVSMPTKIIVAVGGAKGAGKTSLITLLSAWFPDFKIYQIGKKLQIMSKKSYATNFVNLKNQQKWKLRNKLADEISKDPASKFIDLHYGEFENEGYPCVIPEKLICSLTHAVIVKCPIDLVRSRRMTDIKKRRNDIVSITLNIIGELLWFNEITSANSINKLIVDNKNIQKSAYKVKKFITRKYVRR